MADLLMLIHVVNDRHWNKADKMPEHLQGYQVFCYKFKNDFVVETEISTSEKHLKNFLSKLDHIHI